MNETEGDRRQRDYQTASFFDQLDLAAGFKNRCRTLVSDRSKQYSPVSISFSTYADMIESNRRRIALFAGIIRRIKVLTRE